MLVANETEAAILAGEVGGPGGLGDPADAGMALVARGCPTVVTTLGARGALVATGAGVTPVPAFPVESVDSTAAGDAFCGTLAAGLAAGLTLMAALPRAAAAGALATTVTGAVASLPSRNAVDGLVDRSGPTRGSR